MTPLSDDAQKTAATGTQHVEVTPGAAGENNLTHDWVYTTDDARQAINAERHMTVREALRRYPQACLWSMVIALTIVMDGYDGALLGSLSAFPSFRRHFGHYVNEKNGYQLDAHWQLALGCSSPIGNIVGIFLGAITTDRFGYKKSLIGWLLFLTGCIFISFFATRISVIFAGEVLCGTSWGVFATMAPAYAAEVCPVVLRGLLEIFVVACWGIGQLLSFSVLLTLNHNETNWGWRIPFAVQWVWPAIIIPLAVFLPESPWWLVRKGKKSDAEKVIKRLSPRANEIMVRQTVALMVETNTMEMEMHKGTGYIDCFRGTNLWRTEIACAAWSAQLWCGFVIAAFATYFYELAGLAASDAYKMSVGQGGIHIAFNIISIPVVANVGRRKLYLYGLAVMSLMMFMIGFVALAPQSPAVGYASSVLFWLWNCTYQLSVGPGAYIIVSEISSTRLRAKTIGLARNAYNLSLLVNYFVGPYILNPSEGNWRGKTGFLTGGLIIFFWVWAFFRLPESKGRTFAELDIMFSNKELKARDFKSHRVNVATIGDVKEDPAVIADEEKPGAAH